ncbi:MAG: hypothetical protein QS721_00410 [Candidatus Endonucleobacter sp. (ex Gigantidas childressi)]|nr:hypothetical protein [Candidatus Endonucleobacter sp. (ex Gigantidas childressi)]
MDAAYPTQATKITSEWIRKGTNKVINATGSCTWMNILAVIKLGNLAAAIFDQFKTVNGVAVIDFFHKVLRTYTSMDVIHIVLDDTD